MVVALAAFHIAIMVIAAAIFVAAAVSDACTYRIPNYMCAALLVLFPLFVATSPAGIDWHQNLAVFGLVVISGFAMFLGHLAGAGDIKLLSVAALWAGPHLIAVLLVVTAITGGVVSIVMAGLTHYRHRKSETEDAPHLAKIPIPYGIAIAAGGLTTLGMIAQPILLPN
ncbi:MAG: prepilin peptidase [Alphaproteobacteria bacterium]|nr:prepilin peptidase [Alphaproteobacteria bacterium]